jgi:hypothetical protein
LTLQKQKLRKTKRRKKEILLARKKVVKRKENALFYFKMAILYQKLNLKLLYQGKCALKLGLNIRTTKQG